MTAAVIAHCDWSLDPSKRWMAVAVASDTVSGRVWQLADPEPVGDTASLVERLQARAEQQGCLLMGFDFPIGLPAWYGNHTGLGSFPEALAAFGSGEWQSWYRVAEHASEISIHRPFYPMRPGGTLRAHLATGLGAADLADLSRQCERATVDRSAACMLFWTLGGNQVGKAAITGWRELVIPHRANVGLWPFDGHLTDLMRQRDVVMAETYPGDVYRRIGIPRNLAWSKRRQDGRQRVAPYLLDWISSHDSLDASAVIHPIKDGFGPHTSGEDPFDALVGLFGMIDVATGARPEGAPDDPSIRQWEGWILGQRP